MGFRLLVRLPGRRGLPGTSDCALASEAFTVYRRLAGTGVRVEQILDLRAGRETPISGAELEAMAQCECRARHDAVLAEVRGRRG